MSAPAIVLASASPRRKQLLEEAGIAFDVQASQASEQLPASAWADPEQAVLLLATRKAQAVADELGEVSRPTQVIGADTVVVVDGEVYGKPANLEEARRMIETMAGRAHLVITGVSIVLLSPGAQARPAACDSFAETSRVFFKPLSNEDIEGYLAKGESLDKAGAYAIRGEGHVLVDRYEGDYDNIVGLPVARLLEALKRQAASFRLCADAANGQVTAE